MKKILVTQRLFNNKSYFEQREMLDISWGKLFEKIDLLPIILPYEYDFKKYCNEFKIDGIFLTGGNDLSSVNQNDLSLKRDNLEFKLIKYAIENSIPIFGVCRGMQIIAKYFGSDLNKIDGQINIKHKLIVNENSKYSKYLNSLKEVNSFHNYLIENISNDLIVSATSEDKTIKAIEHKDKRIFAQMWHSERVEPFDNNELNLIKEFFS
ncbi:MAG: gamma-glutamyl-gamma-aminobutyrate hydrolase family protein [Arcobacteraceae bacterium]|nr:gamma-glutamyl-gamma-aminobutyrate hydrolase family protein [Arcobacteraceae bacterium]